LNLQPKILFWKVEQDFALVLFAGKGNNHRATGLTQLSYVRAMKTRTESLKVALHQFLIFYWV